MNVDVQFQNYTPNYTKTSPILKLISKSILPKAQVLNGHEAQGEAYASLKIEAQQPFSKF